MRAGQRLIDLERSLADRNRVAIYDEVAGIRGTDRAPKGAAVGRHRCDMVERAVEIAEREGVPLATVATWMRRGREELRGHLGPLLSELRESR